MNQTMILNGDAILLLDDAGCVTGIRFPNWPDPTDIQGPPIEVSFNRCKAVDTSTEWAKALLATRPPVGA